MRQLWAGPPGQGEPIRLLGALDGKLGRPRDLRRLISFQICDDNSEPSICGGSSSSRPPSSLLVCREHDGLQSSAELVVRRGVAHKESPLPPSSPRMASTRLAMRVRLLRPNRVLGLAARSGDLIGGPPVGDRSRGMTAGERVGGPPGIDTGGSARPDRSSSGAPSTPKPRAGAC
eukprot:CAMPEP_0203883964 /NCGR_PEP_ID=MMETSP0359-20131031/28036_1 /ASSEMBLY_ACC=CAM_ASM_000338 /TAXON_ID=268821 /ORGANISM="Scrippsiella Hangoei, Strain SHTV-5" /LENGTH=174 /DNA_ID=CAMNT_0050804319 /DNA_START=246 /DNA_END=767 /DNA_ORIENTATION=+